MAYPAASLVEVKVRGSLSDATTTVCVLTQEVEHGLFQAYLCSVYAVRLGNFLFIFFHARQTGQKWF